VISSITYPTLNSGSYTLENFDFSVNPSSLGEYMSVTQPLGELKTTSGKSIVLAFNQ